MPGGQPVAHQPSGRLGGGEGDEAERGHAQRGAEVLVQEHAAPGDDGPLTGQHRRAQRAEEQDAARPASPPSSPSGAVVRPRGQVLRGELLGRQPPAHHQDDGRHDRSQDQVVRGERHTRLRCGPAGERPGHGADAPCRVAAVHDGTVRRPFDHHRLRVHARVEQPVRGADEEHGRGQVNGSAGEAHSEQGEGKRDCGDPHDPRAADPRREAPGDLRGGERRHGDQGGQEPEQPSRQIVIRLQRRRADRERGDQRAVHGEHRRHRRACPSHGSPLPALSSSLLAGFPSHYGHASRLPVRRLPTGAPWKDDGADADFRHPGAIGCRFRRLTAS